jgi:predicted peroxiredoxin
MASVFVNVTHGPEHPTRAALGFFVARLALEQGHEVSMFLAGDAVQLMRDEVLDVLEGIGTGKLREHFDVIAERGGKIYLSKMSSKTRGLDPEDLEGKPAEMVMPDMLVRLALEHDKTFTY